MGTEPLLQALATTNTAVVEGLNTQMHALQEERAALDEERDRVAEGSHSVEALVEAGRKAHHMRLAELGARAETMDAVMRETKEERQLALIATNALDKAINDIHLQHDAHAKELARKLDAMRGLLDAALAGAARPSWKGEPHPCGSRWPPCAGGWSPSTGASESWMSSAERWPGKTRCLRSTPKPSRQGRRR